MFDPELLLTVPAWLLYPTDQAPRPERFGPYPLDVALDTPATGEGLFLVVFSHGGGSTPWVHRGLLTHLARQGFVVAVLEHPGNNRRDNSLSDPTGVARLPNLENRPRHLGLVIDAALADPTLGPRLSQARVAVIGESIGGYTALAIAGGHAMTLPDDVDHARRSDPDDETRRRAFPVVTHSDPRVQAVVLLSPAIGFFLADGALADVRAPVLARAGERDELCPVEQIRGALRSLPDPSRLDLVVVAGAGHFSYQTPYPPEMAKPGFLPSQDPPGFDRAGYQQTLQSDVTAFLRAALSEG